MSRQHKNKAALVWLLALSTLPIQPRSATAGPATASTEATPRGIRLPDPERIGPSLAIRRQGRTIRELYFYRDKSPEAARVSNHFRYFIDPTLDPIAPESPPAGFPRWVTDVRYVGEDEVRFLMRLRLISDELRDTARTTLSVAEADQLSALVASGREASATPKRAEQPTISVEKLPISSLRIDLLDRTDRSVLASGSAETVGLGDDVDLWFVVNRAGLARLLETDARGDLALRPTYSYFNRPMAEAVQINAAELSLEDELATVLGTRQWTEGVQVAQWTRDKFVRAAEAKIRSKLVASHPQAAALVVNHATLLAGTLMQRVGAVPFEQFVNSPAFDREAMARHLYPHGFERIDAQSDDKTVEFRHIDRSATSVEGGLSVAVPISGAKLGVNFGAGKVQEVIDSTYRKTGILLQHSDKTGGYRPAMIDVYRVVADSHRVSLASTAEVMVGLDSVEGVFGGTPFNLAELTPEVIRESLAQTEASYRGPVSLLRRMNESSRIARAELTRLAERIDGSQQAIEELGGLSLKARSAVEAQAAKAGERAKNAGFEVAYTHAGDHIYCKHRDTFDKDEAFRTLGWFNTTIKDAKLIELGNRSSKLDAEYATIEASTRDAEALLSSKASDLSNCNEEIIAILDRAYKTDTSLAMCELKSTRASRQFSSAQEAARELAGRRNKAYQAMDARIRERQIAVDVAINADLTAFRNYAEFPDHLKALGIRLGELAGREVVYSAWVEHVRDKHDEGEAGHLRGWSTTELANFASKWMVDQAQRNVDGIPALKAESAKSDTAYQAQVTKLKAIDIKVKVQVEDLVRLEDDLAEAMWSLVRLSAQ
ncbi:hypothetical protein V5E97_17455 [Singulisphaera sp. Ch08]|uniref:Uncharacterized protein n=1 Tax=Singulisphaera sp. Ch08 TaxID=3120278 RepID=A0AAU7CQB1_9BACT